MAEDFVTSQQGEPNVSTEGQGTPATQTPATDLFELKHGGRTHQLSREDVIKLAQQGFDYTQKTQGFADRERGYQGRISQYEAAIAEVREFLQDRAKVKAYYDQLAQGSPEPNDIPTAEQVQQMLQQMTVQQQESFNRELARLRDEFEVNQLSATFSEKINTQISALLTQHPELRSVPRIEKALKDEVAARNPRDIGEALQAMTEVAEGFSRQILDFANQQKKAAATQSASLQKGIEPPGGGAAPASPGAPQKFRNFSDPSFKQMVLEDLQKMMGGGGS